MIKGIIIILTISFLLVSCDGTNQYNLYVHNKTGTELKVVFKSLTHKTGPIEKTIIIKDQDMQMIVSTINIKSTETLKGPSSHHCNQVAEYVYAFINDSIPTTKKWCSTDVEFATVDIGQGEFYIEYTQQDF